MYKRIVDQVFDCFDEASLLTNETSPGLRPEFGCAYGSAEIDNRLSYSPYFRARLFSIGTKSVVEKLARAEPRAVILNGDIVTVQRDSIQIIRGSIKHDARHIRNLSLVTEAMKAEA